jgi:hypothetical protein
MKLNYNTFLELNINTGKFYYTCIPHGLSKPKIIGDEAGCHNSQGYIIVNNKLAHILFVEFILGFKLPDGYVPDHIDNDKENNTPENLRIVTHQENSIHDKIENSKCYNPNGKKFQVRMVNVPIQFHNKMKKESNSNRYFSSSMSEQECFELASEIKLYFQDRLNKILTLRQIIDTLSTPEWWLP